MRFQILQAPLLKTDQKILTKLDFEFLKVVFLKRVSNRHQIHTQWVALLVCLIP